MKIMEIRRKMRWKFTSCMWGGKWRKIMENEENRGLIHKKASKDQLTSFFLSLWTFCQFSLRALSLFSPSHSLGYLEFSGRTLGGCGVLGFLEQEGKGRVGKWNKASTSTTTSDFLGRIEFHVWFLHYFLAFMAYACGFLIVICHYDGGFPGSKVDFLALQFSGWWLSIYFHCFDSFGCHVSLAWVELLVLEALVWTNNVEAL